MCKSKQDLPELFQLSYQWLYDTGASNHFCGKLAAESFKKYDSVKVSKLVTNLQTYKLEPDFFGREIQNYFCYHQDRKENVIEQLRDQVLLQKKSQQKLMLDQQKSNWMVARTRNDAGPYTPNLTSSKANLIKSAKPLQSLFIEHLNHMKAQMRQRRALLRLQNDKAKMPNKNVIASPELKKEI